MEEGNPEISIDDIREVSSDVRQIKGKTQVTGRDVQDIKDDVGAIRDQLDIIQSDKAAKKQRRAPNPDKRKPLPYFSTKQGSSSLTGVSLNDLALRIKAQNPSKTFSDARKDARNLKDAHATINTGGGGLLANAKLGLLRKTLGENLGTKVSRFLTPNKSQEKAAQTLLNYDSQKAQRIQAAEPVQALEQQITQLTKAVEKNTAVRVEVPKAKPAPKVKEDLSDAISALKVLGFEMKEIKDRLSTLPRGLSTEDQIKHALKSSAERIKASEVKTVVAQTIAQFQQVGKDQSTGKPRVRVVDKPVTITPVTPVAPEPDKPDTKLNDRIESMFKAQNDSDAPVRTPIRTPIKQDEIVNREKIDASKEEKDAKDKKDSANKSEVNKKLDSIQRGLKDLHSESFMGLLVMAIGALLVPLIKKAIEGVQWVHEKLQPMFDMVTNIWNKYFSNDVKTLNGRIQKAYTDANVLAMKADQEGDPNKALQIREAANRKIEQIKEDENQNDKLRKEGQATSAEEAIKLGKKSYTTYEDGSNRIHVMNENDYKDAGVDPPASMIKPVKKPKVKIEPTKAPSTLKNQADALQKATDEKSQTDSKPTASTIVVPMPTKETQVAVPVNMGGGDSAIAVLAARNDDPTTQSYIGSLFDHPATYGALGRV